MVERNELPSTAVCDLGILFDSDFAMHSPVLRTVPGCFAVLQQLCSMRSCYDFLPS